MTIPGNQIMTIPGNQIMTIPGNPVPVQLSDCQRSINTPKNSDLFQIIKMTGKTKKDLQAENTALKEEVSNLKIMYETLSEKYENLQTKSTLDTESRKNTFKCNKCDTNFETMREFKAHKNKHDVTNKMFECDKCERVFNEERKMIAHRKTYTKYQCEYCNKTLTS